MKHLIALALLCLVFGCKKDNSFKQVDLDISVPANTTYNFQVKNSSSGSTDIGISDSETNFQHSITAKSGDKLLVTFYFTTQGYQYGQGTATFTYGSKTLLTINGGNGNQTVNVP